MVAPRTIRSSDSMLIGNWKTRRSIHSFLSEHRAAFLFKQPKLFGDKETCRAEALICKWVIATVNADTLEVIDVEECLRDDFSHVFEKAD